MSKPIFCLLTGEVSHAFQIHPSKNDVFNKCKVAQLGQDKWYFAKEKNTFLSASSGWPCCGWTKSSAAENFVRTGLLKRLISLKIGRLLGPALVGGILAISYRCMRLTIGCFKSSQIFGPNHCRQTEVVFAARTAFSTTTQRDRSSKAS